MDALSRTDSPKPRIVLRNEGLAEFYERKSRFIGHCAPVQTEEEALAFLERVRGTHKNAAHNVYAYRVYENNLCRHSDDGEPSGTAGLPLLECFLRREVYDFCCVATRYFGGILLGAGGLTRAYAHTGSIALEAAGTATLRLWRTFSLHCPYHLFEALRRLLEAHGAGGIETDFAADVTLRAAVPEEEWLALNASLRETTSGAVKADGEGLSLQKFM